VSSPEGSQIRLLFKKYDIVMFYLIAFALTWFGWLAADRAMAIFGPDSNWVELIAEGHLYMIFYPVIAILGGARGPLVSAFIIYHVNYGGAGSKALLKKVLNWRVALPWYILAFGLPILIKYGAFYFNVWFLGGTFIPDLETASILTILMTFGSELIPTGGQEEVGWTGFAQLRLQQHTSVVNATLIKALLGWVWHLPLFLVFPWDSSFGGNIWLFLFFYIAIAFILTWLFNNTNSVLIPALFHASFNTVGSFAQLYSTSLDASTLTVVMIGLLAYIIVVFAFVKFGKNLTRKELPQLDANRHPDEFESRKAAST
jgi:membrane protease YdiL (CAAX protease family)